MRCSDPRTVFREELQNSACPWLLYVNYPGREGEGKRRKGYVEGGGEANTVGTSRLFRIAKSWQW